jgi:hypothetical protein
MDEQGEQRALADALDRFSRKADEILKSGNTNTARIEVNAGGVGIWLCLIACVAMLSVTVVGSVYLTRELGEQDRQLQELREKDVVHDAWLQTLNNNKQDKTK